MANKVLDLVLPRDGFLHKDEILAILWFIISTVGAYSYGHSDGSGMATYILDISGVKIWGILWLRPMPPADETPVRRSTRGAQQAAERTPSDRAFAQMCEVARYSQKYEEAPDAMKRLTTAHNVMLYPGAVLYVTHLIIFHNTHDIPQDSATGCNPPGVHGHGCSYSWRTLSMQIGLAPH